MCFVIFFICLCFFIIISGVVVDRELYIGSESQSNADDDDEKAYVLAGEPCAGIDLV